LKSHRVTKIAALFLLLPAGLTGQAVQRAAELLHATGAAGVVPVTDVRSVAVVASAASVPADLNTPLLPLSVIKVFPAAICWEHSACPEGEDLIVKGSDAAGRQLAVALRPQLGGQAVLDELRRYRLNTISLAADSSDAAWGDALSIGESGFRTTILEISRFLQVIGHDGVNRQGRRILKRTTARHLQRAMRERSSAEPPKTSATVCSRQNGSWAEKPGQVRETQGPTTAGSPG